MKSRKPGYDPLVEEVRKRGVEYAAGFHFDIEKMVLDLRLRQQARGGNVVSFSREELPEDLNPELSRRHSR